MKKPPFTIKPYRDAKRPSLRYVVRGKIEGKWQRKFFSAEAQAKTYAQLKNTELYQHGREAVEFSPRLRVMAQECSELLSTFGKTLDDATQFFVSHLRVTAKSCTLKKLFEETIASKKASGFCKGYVQRLGYLSKSFCQQYPEGKLAAEITTRDINAFMGILAERNLDGRTRNGARGNLRTVFEFGRINGFCSANPVKDSAPAKEVSRPVGILTPDEVARLLAAASPRVLPALAIGAFAGIRCAEITRLRWEEIDLESGFIEITAKNSKTSTRRIVKILPCLDAWLRPFAKETGKIVDSVNVLNDWREAACERAGLPAWPKNALRHSFASYHIAHFKDAASLALEMGHSTTRQIFLHYREVVRPVEAARYFSVMPGSQKETELLFAFTAEAYSWFCKPFPVDKGARGSLAKEYQFVVWERPGVGLFQRKGFVTLEKAKAFCDNINAEFLRKELQGMSANQELRRFPNLVPMLAAAVA